MAVYKTPDVYVEEISTLPPSVAEVATAIPVFIGYTEKVTYNNKLLTNVPTRIASFLEFKTMFGYPLLAGFDVTIHDSDNMTVVRKAALEGEHNLYYSLDHYFRNGGGDCYIVTLGTYQTKTTAAFEAGIDALLLEDEPTLIILSEAATLPDPDYFSLCDRALQQCQKLMDRFCIFDVTNVGEFRTGVGGDSSKLSYGAAYYPYLETTLNYLYDEKQVSVELPNYSWGGLMITAAAVPTNKPAIEVRIETATDDSIAVDIVSNKLTVLIKSKTPNAPAQKWEEVVAAWNGVQDKEGFEMDVPLNKRNAQVKALQTTELDFQGYKGNTGQYSKVLDFSTISFSGSTYKQFGFEAKKGEPGTAMDISFAGDKLTVVFPPDSTQKNVQDAWNKLSASWKKYFVLSLQDNGEAALKEVTEQVDIKTGTTLDAISETQTALYNSIKLEINKQRIILPPSPAMAGVYAAVDRDRGVWKAPANVALSSVIAPTVKISTEEQTGLNVDDTGKSINAIRGFIGKGTLVWGARTLAGNDNEWRYVNVRRLFNMIEESTKKASYFAVFESNTATTWLKVKGMIESFLYRLWQQGALAGSTPKAAYFVHVGLGVTMTQQDILEGRMIVEIGVAAVRPAEFIVLRFSHKLQEA
ncbi:MAG: phage tail protein [Williamsia sp.]|nr:phage tail protein [Williamsia sp.]